MDNSQPATFQVSLPGHQRSGSWAESMDLSIHHHPAGTHAAAMSVCDMTFGGDEGQTKEYQTTDETSIHFIAYHIRYYNCMGNIEYPYTYNYILLPASCPRVPVLH